jgi:hypothetical protein
MMVNWVLLGIGVVCSLPYILLFSYLILDKINDILSNRKHKEKIPKHRPGANPKENVFNLDDYDDAIAKDWGRRFRLSTGLLVDEALPKGTIYERIKHIPKTAL